MRVNKVINNEINTNNDNFNNIIFPLYLFIVKLYKKLKEQSFNEVFFLAREGEFLKKLFDYYLLYLNDNTIKTHYLLVSRKSTYLPSLLNVDEEDFSYLFNQYSSISPYEFLSSLNFSEDETKRVISSLDIIAKKRVENFKNSVDFMKIKDSPIFKRIFEKKRIKQKKLFISYFKSFNSGKKVAFVDIGWNGSIQDNISRILGSNYFIQGFYFGLQVRSNCSSDNKYGLVFSNTAGDNLKVDLYNENRSIFEVMCDASHGSACSYYESNDTVKVELLYRSEESNLYTNMIKPYQNDMFKIFKKICPIIKTDNDISTLDSICDKIIYNLFINPTKNQIYLYKKMCHYENFGVFYVDNFDKKFSIKNRLKEFAKFFLKRSVYFYDASWPIFKLMNNKMYFLCFVYKIKSRKKYKHLIKNNT